MSNKIPQGEWTPLNDIPFKIVYGGSRPPGPSVFTGIDYLSYTCLPITLLY